MGKRPRRTTNLNDSHAINYPFLIKKPNLGDGMVECTLCNSTFSMGNGGVSKITQHINQQKHKNAEKAKASTPQVTEFYRKVVPTIEEYDLAAKEGSFSYHIVKHDQSFRSMDCTSKLVKYMFEPKFASARTKAEAIAVNVLAPAAFSSVYNDLEKVRFVSVSLDCSNRKSQKMCPIVVRYFLPESGVNVRFLKVHDLKNETASTLCTKLYETVKKHGLKEKISSMCADNTNTNFGGMRRRGENNVFTLLKGELKRDIIGIGCAAHIVNNDMETACDTLSIDFDGIVFKIYRHFSIYTVRTEKLKDFCESVDVEYEQLLSSSRTRWLTLLPALERLLKVYPAVKEYFLSEPGSPQVLIDFFQSAMNEVYLWFVHCQSSMFHSIILQIEGKSPSAMEVLISLNNLLNLLKMRKDQKYIGLHAKSLLKKVVSEIPNESEEEVEEVEIELVDDEEKAKKVHPVEKAFYEKVERFYNRAITYLENWKKPFEALESLNWVLLNKMPTWDEVEISIEFAKTQLCFTASNIDYEKIFDEFGLISSYINQSKIASWNLKESATYLKPDQRWVEIFGKMKEDGLSVNNIMGIVDFAFSLPGTSAPVERVFSLINNYWTNEKHAMLLETVESVLCLKMNVDLNCIQYYNWLKGEQKLLKEIHASEKYSFKTKKDNNNPEGTEPRAGCSQAQP